MAITTSQAISGFISDDPRLSYSQDGQPRFYARVGIKHFERTDDGQFRRLANSYHDLIQFGKAAELSYERFSKGDEFVAQGSVRNYTREVDGQTRTDEQFLARRIAHDPNTTTYTVDRRPAAERNGADREAVDRKGTDRDPTERESAPAQRGDDLGTAEPIAKAKTSRAKAATR